MKTFIAGFGYSSQKITLHKYTVKKEVKGKTCVYTTE